MKLSAYEQLEIKLDKKQTEKELLEARLAVEFQKAVDTIKNPAPYIKSTVSELASDKKFLSDLISLILHFAATYMGAKMKGDSGKMDFIRHLFTSAKGEGDFSWKDLLQKIFSSGKKKDSENKTSDD